MPSKWLNRVLNLKAAQDCVESWTVEVLNNFGENK